MKVTILFVFAAALLAQDHHSGVDKRGDHVMGFSHEKTTHHFLLYTDGGAIEVQANAKDDAESRDQIRTHLRHIATMFSNGNFQAPMLVHDQTPPGVPAMEKLISQIAFSYREMDRGAAVDIKTTSPDALKAVHEFLRFQISDHRTGDPTTVAKRN
jgi:hypothetical protein